MTGMNVANALRLARSAAAADRTHARLATTCLAIAGGLLLVTAQIARTQAPDSAGRPGDGTTVVIDGQYATSTLARFITEDGLRPGVVLGTLLLVVPVLALAWQLLRVGSDARNRRMAALRMAGATPAQVRTVAAIEAARICILGGAFAGPAHLLLWVALGVLPPAGAKLVPDPQLPDLVAWLVLIVLAGVGGAAAGAVVRQPLISEPLRAGQRTRWWSGSRWATWLAVALGSATAAGVVLGALGVIVLGPDSSWVLGGMIITLVVTAMVLGAHVVRWLAGRLRARGTPVDVLAAAFLTGAPGPTGRVAGVLWICGIGLGIAAIVVADVLQHESMDSFFYLSGTALAVGVILIGIVVAAVTLAVGMVERIHDARRPIASLAALGVDEAFLHKVLRRQLTVPSVVAVTAGALTSTLFYAAPFLRYEGIGYTAPALLLLSAIAVVVLLSVPVIHLVTAVVASALRARLREAMDPENLRTA